MNTCVNESIGLKVLLLWLHRFTIVPPREFLIIDFPT